MGGEDDLRAEQGGGADVLDHVVVVAGEDAAGPAAQFEDRVLAAGGEVPADERVQFAVPRPEPLPVHAHVGVVQALSIALHQAGQHRQAVPPGDLHQALRAGPLRHALGQGLHLGAVQILEEGVGSDA
jgi:hypothetical protein